MLETPRSFFNSMEGAALAAKRQYNVAIAQAWHTEMFARAKKLKKLEHYLRDAPAKAQTPNAMLAALREFKARGANMKFRRVIH